MTMQLKADTEAVIGAMLGEVGTEERPAYSNKVKYSDWWGLSAAWCGMFVPWGFDKGGSRLPSMQVGAKTGFAYCPSARVWAQKNGLYVKKPKRGDIVLFDFIGRPSHTGIVQGILPDGRIHTIEGNTDTSGSRTGGRVLQMKRSTSRVDGYISVTSTSKNPRRPVISGQQRLLCLGDVGNDVKFLKALLNIVACKFGFSRLPETTNFDKQTLSAVKIFQRKKGLYQDGEVGSKTLGALTAEVEAIMKAKA